MGKNKRINHFYIYILLLIVLSCKGLMKSNKNHTQFPKVYEYKNEQNTLHIQFEFLINNKFEYREISGLKKKFSQGIYKQENNSVILNSIYPYDLDSGMLKVSNWVEFINDTLIIHNDILKYEIYLLERQVPRNFRNK
jgi:hypothetical protein